jgi:hypothetical protein
LNINAQTCNAGTTRVLLPRQQIAGSRAGLSANLLCWRNPYILPVCAVSPPRILAEILGTLFLLFAAGVIIASLKMPGKISHGLLINEGLCRLNENAGRGEEIAAV